MGSQVRGLNQAARNSNDGISLAQTAEGAMQEVTNNLQRIRELAVQSANDTNSAGDRESLNAEATQLIAEINRVATTTSFNGKVLLDGSFGTAAFQVGANQGQQISFGMISVRANALGVGSGSSNSTTSGALTTLTGALSAGGVTINGHQVGATASDGVSSAGGTFSSLSKANAINAISGDTGVTATVGATTISTTAVSGTARLTAGIIINGVTIDSYLGVSSAAANATTTVAAINEVSSQTGVTASLSAGSTGAYTLTAADGRNIVITTGTAGTSGLTGGVTTFGTVTLSSTSSAGITIGGLAADLTALGATAGYTAPTTTAGAGVSSLDLTTVGGAGNAITIIDAALATIDSARGDLGAIQNRFESTIANLQNVAENVTAARSRIVDADFAAETASMTKAQVMMQAGVAMLAQANQLPQTVLSLLK
jgi:flagellin